MLGLFFSWLEDTDKERFLPAKVSFKLRISLKKISVDSHVLGMKIGVKEVMQFSFIRFRKAL